jgi:hypothetical protein
MEIKKRKCSNCKIDKELNSDNFCKDKHSKTGFVYACRICSAARQRQWVVNNPGKVKEYNDRNNANAKTYYQTPKGIISSRRAHLKRMFGITLEQYETKLIEQNYGCSICGKPEMNSKNKVLCVDHNHTTGQIRGLLCGLCNSGLGKFLENKQLLLNTIKYIEKWDKQQQ